MWLRKKNSWGLKPTWKRKIDPFEPYLDILNTPVRCIFSYYASLVTKNMSKVTNSHLGARAHNLIYARGDIERSIRPLQ